MKGVNQMSVLDREQVRELYDEQADNYDASLARFRLFGLRRWQNRLMKGLSLPEGVTVIDLCCGTGGCFLGSPAGLGATDA